jgi:hypothetical protein
VVVVEEDGGKIALDVVVEGVVVDDVVVFEVPGEPEDDRATYAPTPATATIMTTIRASTAGAIPFLEIKRNVVP